MIRSAAAETGVLWRALPVARVVLLGYAVVVNAVHVDEYRHAALAWVVLGVLAGWTAAAPWVYADPPRRPAAIGVEFALAVAALLLTPVAQGPDVGGGVPTLSSFWLAAPVLAAAVLWEWRGGLAAGFVAGVAVVGEDAGANTEFGNNTAANVFLLVVSGLVVGYASTLLRTSAEAQAQAVAIRAATAERERLARAVHDGVLQALAWVQRRGTELGGEAAELAAVAGEQEAALRGLIGGGPAGAGTLTSGAADVAAMLSTCATPSVSVAVPGSAVPLPADVAGELVAAVRAALDNSARHAPGAKAYVFCEDEGSAVVVSVGDDGPGIAEGRLDEAAAAGRMGVAHSIRSRMTAVGGSATLQSARDRGTEWELRVPR